MKLFLFTRGLEFRDFCDFILCMHCMLKFGRRERGQFVTLRLAPNFVYVWNTCS